MTDSFTESEEAVDTPRPPTEDELAELRHLLLAPEQTKLERLQERLNDPRFGVESVSRVLPEAVTLRTARDKQLTNALMPSVADAFTASVKRDPQKLVDIIFPILGPAIRRSISHALSEIVQSLNQTLEHSISLESLKWRWEAYRTRKSFAEVVLYHKLVYLVEQVFLIHRQTGLLLKHVAADLRVTQDPDLVSGMLTAIQDFVRDSFGAESTDSLSEFTVGELTVWVEQSTDAILAAVIRGTPPLELRHTLEDALSNIQREQFDALESFEGDTTPFEASREHLESCLQKQLKSRDKGSPLLWIIPALLLVALATWLFFSIRDSRRWDAYVDRLKSNPGIIVVNNERRGGKYFISGLRDPLAVDPTGLIQQTRIDPEDVVSRWEPYQAVYPQFVLARAERLLEPPRTVRLRFEGSTLYASGLAPREWITEARKLARAVPGVDQFQEEGLVDLSEIESIKREIEQTRIGFEVGSAELTADQGAVIERAAAAVKKLAEYCQSVGKQLRVEILGYTDRSGSEQLNSRLSQERAERVLAAFVAEGVGQDGLLTKGMGIRIGPAAAPEAASFDSNRVVQFRVISPEFTEANR